MLLDIELTTAQNCDMSNGDARQRAETVEYAGRARRRYDEYYDALPLDVIEDAFATNWTPTTLDDLDPEVRDDLAATVIEESELIGFWVAWHKAGGFDRLEAGGWHRATIFRKIKRFKDFFGDHPDTWQPNWIRLDLRTTWSDDLRRRLNPGPEPD